MVLFFFNTTFFLDNSQIKSGNQLSDSRILSRVYHAHSRHVFNSGFRALKIFIFSEVH